MHRAAAISPAGFQFLDHGPLRDGELELIRPARAWLPDLMAALNHPHTAAELRDAPQMRRDTWERFLTVAPGGNEPADPASGKAPAYHFWMRILPQPQPVDLPIVGTISLRVGDTFDLRMYSGNIGYGVYPFARGRRYALRACRLLLPLATRHGLDPLWITVSPENVPSRRTCELLGCRLVETVPVPRDHILHQRGEFFKCRYRLDLAKAVAALD